MSEEADISIVRKHAEELGEHFDSVQIFCTRHESAIEDGTVCINYGSGNFYARYGQINEWMIRQEERTRENTRKDD